MLVGVSGCQCLCWYVLVVDSASGGASGCQCQ